MTVLEGQLACLSDIALIYGLTELLALGQNKKLRDRVHPQNELLQKLRLIVAFREIRVLIFGLEDPDIVNFSALLPALRQICRHYLWESSLG